MADPAAAAAAVLDRHAPPGPLGVAVSGGGDSTALLLIVLRWAGGRRVEAATVDHGLRPEAAAEAAAVARLCAARGVPHAVLRWEGWEGRGNLAAAAREARLALLGDWARARGLGAVCLGHTLDDQAETVLMRLARGAGVDGLSGMAQARRAGGLAWLRPLLEVRREDLRALLRAEGVGWAEDPTNDDPAHERVRARRALAVLAEIGIGAEGLAATAARLRAQRGVLEGEMARLACTARAAVAPGAFRLDAAALAAAHPETAMRLLADTLMRVAGRIYRPRGAPLARLLGALGEAGALHGCLLRPGPGGVLVVREPAAMAGRVPLAPGGVLWDGRFRVTGAAEGEVGALGAAGLAALRRHDAPPGWRAAPRLARLAAPALWRGEALVAAPHAGFGPPLHVVAIAHEELPETQGGA